MKPICRLIDAAPDILMRQHLTIRLTCVVALLAVFLIAASAGGAGYWNVPSSFSQHMGYGFGAGYHAPLVLGPVSCDNLFVHNNVRLPYAPAPPYACHGHGHCCGICGESSWMPPQVMPPAPSVPVGTRTIFAPPVEP